MVDYLYRFHCGRIYPIHHTFPDTIRSRPETQVSNVLFITHHPKWSPSVFDLRVFTLVTVLTTHSHDATFFQLYR